MSHERQLDAVVWCPGCKEPKYTLWRVPTGAEGVYVNHPDPKENYEEAKNRKGKCACGTILERKT